MACCAFAVFLIGQALFALERFRDLIFGPPKQPRAHGAAAWRPGAAAVAVPATPWRWTLPSRRAVGAVVAFDLVLLTLAAGGWSAWSAMAPGRPSPWSVICRVPRIGAL